MKLARIVDPRFRTALQKIVNATGLPIRTAFRLKGIVKTVNEEYSKYEELRENLLNLHGSKDADGKLIIIENSNPPAVKLEGENLQLFAKELSELANEEIQLSKLKLSELGDIQVTFEDVEMLDGLLIDQ